jgi:hypothetical protein
MKTTAHHILAWALALLLCSPFVVVHTQDANKISAQEARQIAEDVYIYGYSLVTMEMTRRVMTNVRELEGT